MKVNSLLKEIKMEILAIAEKNKSNQYYDSKYNVTNEVNKIVDSYKRLKETVESLEVKSNFLQRLKIKNDLKKIHKLFMQKYSDDSYRILNVRCEIDKLIAKYNVKYASKIQELKSSIEDNVQTADDEEFKNELRDKIARIRKKVEEDKKVNGIHCDEPVQTFSINEIKETAERQARIKRAMENAKISRKKQAEQWAERDRVVQEEISEQKNGGDSTHIDEPIAKTREKKKLPWYATIPVIGALAVSAVSGVMAVFNHNSGDKDDSKYSGPNNSYSDSINPTESSESTKTVDTHTTNSTYVQTTQRTTATTSQQNESTTTTPNNIDELQENLSTVEPVVINITDKINVPDGLKYTSNCLGGGNSNKIGAVSWRPATEYSIDNVAFCYNGKLLGTMKSEEGDVKQQLNNYANQYHIDVDDISTSVLLSLVPGQGDTGWAEISVDEMEKNVCKQINEPDKQIDKYEDSDIDR